MSFVFAAISIIVLSTIAGSALGSSLLGCWAGLGIVIAALCVLGEDE